MSTAFENIKTRSDLTVKNVDDGLLILDKRNEKIHQLNSTACFIWAELDAGKSPEKIANRVVEEFDISDDVALEDVRRALEQFDTLQLLEPRKQG